MTATFFLWGERIDAWTQKVVEKALQLALGNAVVSLVYALVGAFFANAERGSWLAFLAAMAVSGVFFLIRSRMVRPEE